nr:uncharacterized protein LOC124808124 [Hydra vulgaris]
MSIINNNWKEFLHQKLLHNNLIDGVAMFTKTLVPLEMYGKLQNLPINQLEQFLNIFTNIKSQPENVAHGFTIDINLQEVKFVIRHYNFHSVYSVSKANQMGLIVINLPFGVIVSSHTYPVTSAVASQHVEDVCYLLR